VRLVRSKGVFKHRYAMRSRSNHFTVGLSHTATGEPSLRDEEAIVGRYVDVVSIQGAKSLR